MDSSVQPIKNDCIIILQQSTEIEINRNIIFISTLSLRIVMPLYKAEASARDRKRARKNYHNICNNYSHLIWAFSKMKSTYGLCLVLSVQTQWPNGHKSWFIRYSMNNYGMAGGGYEQTNQEALPTSPMATCPICQSPENYFDFNYFIENANGKWYFRCCLFWTPMFIMMMSKIIIIQILRTWQHEKLREKNGNTINKAECVREILRKFHDGNVWNVHAKWIFATVRINQNQSARQKMFFHSSI